MTHPTPDAVGYFLDEYDFDRFWDCVNFRGGTDHEDDPLSTAKGECWTWRSKSGGYARFLVYGRWHAAHRIALRDANVKVPDDMVVDHLCRNPPCVNPSHLEMVTHTENVRRGKAGQRTHCKHGHEFTEDNLIWSRGGKTRQCRTCTLASRKRSYQRRKALATT